MIAVLALLAVAGCEASVTEGRAPSDDPRVECTADVMALCTKAMSRGVSYYQTEAGACVAYWLPKSCDGVMWDQPAGSGQP
jgi:hypothetical protein